MSIKEDILEQLVEEYLLHQGYFIQHNIKFRPRGDHPDFATKQDSNHSDIDVVGIHPRRNGVDRVVAVSCKSWQGGFNPRAELEAIRQNKIVSGRERWRTFRELVSPKWAAAFLDRMEELNRTRSFKYITAVTRIDGDKILWEEHAEFRERLAGNPIEVLDLRQLLATVLPGLTTTVANTNIGRLLQLIKAAGVTIKT